MNHDEVKSLLEAFLDDEMDLATSLAVETHVQECPQCKSWLEERRRLAAHLGDLPLRYETPERLLSAIRAQWPPAEPRRRRISAWFGGVALSTLLVVGGYFLGHGLHPPAPLGAELVDAHIRSVLSPHAVDVVSSDRHTVRPWLSSQLPFSPPVPELTTQGDVLVGGRVDVLNGVRVAALVYRHGQHDVNVFVWPTSTTQLAAPVSASRDGYRIASSRIESFTVTFVTDLSADELQAFQTRWRDGAAVPRRAESP